jgi:hypothetical protein
MKNNMNLPNFLILSAGKAGTTSLYHYLKQHPEIYMSPIKEPGFFAFEGETLDFSEPGSRILNSLIITDYHQYCALFEGVSNEKAIGEASNKYFTVPKAVDRIKHYLPNVKLIFVLRDPVDRAYSWYMMGIRDNVEPLSDFRSAIRDSEKRRRENRGNDYITSGYYYQPLKRYYERFHQDRIKIFLYEDMQNDPVKFLKDIFRFLEVDETFMPDMSMRYNISGTPQYQWLHSLLTLRPLEILRKWGKASQGKALHSVAVPIKGIEFVDFESSHSLIKKLKLESFIKRLIQFRSRNLVKPKLAPEIREELIALYRDDILKLEGLVKRDLSKWLI